MKAALLVCAPLLFAACLAPEQRFEYAAGKMGTPFRLVLHARSSEQADRAAAAAFACIDRLEAALSDWRDDSEIAALSRAAAAVAPASSTEAIPVSTDLWNVLVPAQQIARASSGAFDVTIGPLVALWRRAKRQGELPDPAALARARAATGFEKLLLDPATRTVRLLAPGMQLDLGGIAKGYALDQALLVLRDHQITRALAVGGGDVVAGEPPPGSTGWRIALADLTELAASAPAEPTETLLIAHAAVSTSGDLYQSVEIAGRRFSHIVDPRTGLGLERRLLVTTVARDGTTADALATAVSVLGPEAGLALVAATPGVQARIVTLDGGLREARTSAGFARMVARP